MSTLDHGPYGQTETGAAYGEAAEPAYLLGVAQQAMKTALQLDDPIEIHAYLSEVLERITPEVAA